MHLSSTRYHHHRKMCSNSTTMCSHSTIICNHSITPCSITRYPSTTHHEEIEVDIEVGDEAEEDLDEEKDH
jgi:hypothetical protein